MTAYPKNKTTRGYRPLPCQVPTLVSCRESQISGSSPHSSPEDAGSTAAGFSRCTVASPAGDPLSPRSSPALPQPPQPARAPRKNRGEGKVGRQTVVGEMEDTHPPRQQPTGRGGWGPGLSLGRKTAWSFRNAAAAREAAAAAAPGRRLPPLLCFDSTDHVTLSHETRICRLPRAAAQQIAAARPRQPACRACARPAPAQWVRRGGAAASVTRFEGGGAPELQFRLGGVGRSVV